MRIIGGIYKNRRVDFKNLNIRPTTDFAKEGLFNTLSNYYDLRKISVLELFAGSGSISYEFISRGCKQVVALDSNIKCVNFMKKFKAKLQIKKFEIYLAKAKNYLKKNEKCYDIIFLDPPYNYKQIEYDEIIENIFEQNTLNHTGMIIIEHSKFINFENYPCFLNHKKYGRVNFTFLKQ